jgi:hypothetical protein
VKQTLAYQRCFNHAQREAVARCPECGRFFCRECITEHDERVICSMCLRKLARVPLLQRRGFAGVFQFCQCLLGLLVAWFFLYLIGETLLTIPNSFHKGTMWKANWLDEE